MARAVLFIGLFSTIILTTGGSCVGPDLCCSGLNSSCRRLNCYCDVACLRLNDCCSDFKSTCLTVNQSSTLPVTGTCSHPTLCCSGLNHNCFRGCFCDEACKQHNDCCPDYNSICIFNSTTATPPFNTTASPPKVLTVLTVLVVKVKILLPEEKHQAALLKVGSWVESFLRVNNTDIYSFNITEIKRVSP
ncbi:proteoglycan 4 [Labeo rohita]|uniref:proteoglycan 4 n=1 Tax=Labeo rohita TaxID=84645 RepID=UPI0021E30893|nr:proteoglycan 4 [Labeo rohita]